MFCLVVIGAIAHIVATLQYFALKNIWFVKKIQ